MTAASRARPSPGRQSKRGQLRADRTRELVIEETVRCILEEGFAAASTRHIVERAKVSWGVIQYHFGDREGLLTAVIDHGFETLVESLNELADTVQEVTDLRSRAEMLSASAWEMFSTPTAMGALEILIATRA
ncbi:TetR/AcrR family transcriptional regulator, partial [Mycobacterium sp.]|uniref:TetR/AcrR family transcriptional regulator n=1 Tax=Mycobacterium sp. TaxID=1785 RepID=UPI003F98F353